MVENVRTDKMPQAMIDGVSFAAVRGVEVVEVVMDSLAGGEGGVIATLNVDHVRQAAIDAEFASWSEMANIRVADGMPLVWLSRLTTCPLPERVTGADLIFLLSESLAAIGGRLFVIGGPPGVAEDATLRLETRYEGLKTVGAVAPRLGFDSDPTEVDELGEMVRMAAPDVVFVALGMPRQEALISQLRSYAPEAWWMGVGAGVEFVTGSQKRAPALVQGVGLEWLWRMLREPRRLIPRYLGRDAPYLLGLAVRMLRHRDGDRIEDAPQPDRICGL